MSTNQANAADQAPPQQQQQQKEKTRKKASPKKDLKELKQFKTEQDMLAFFEEERYAKYRYITYQEYVEIFGRTIDSNYLPKINKRIIYGHFDYFNYCYDQTWNYKWYPLLGLFAVNALRLRSCSILGSLAYLYSFDYFFENFFLQKQSERRFIDITKCFTYHLNKRKYIAVRSHYLDSYVQIVNRNIANKTYATPSTEDKFFVIGGKTRGLIGLNENPEVTQDSDFFASFVGDSISDQQTIEDKQQLAYIQKNRGYQLLKSAASFAQQTKLLLQHGDLNAFMNDFLRNGVQSSIRSAISKFKQFQEEFRQYKQNIGSFPTRGDYAMLLYYQDLNQNKVYTFKEKVRERINESIDVFNLIFRRKITKTDAKVVDYVHPDRIDVNPTFKLESYTIDFLTFAIVCCLPFKIVRARSKIQMILQQVKRQRSQFQSS